MTEYTDDQLVDAARQAAQVRGGIQIEGFTADDFLYSVGLGDLRAILNHLPEEREDSEWQEVAEDRVRKGDTLRWVREMSDGTTLTVEGVADYRSGALGAPDGWYSEGHVRLTPSGSPAGVSVPREELYRIPARQAPPNPGEHRLIIDGDGTLYQSTGGRYMTPGPFGTTIEKYPKEFTEWDPVKVVLDNEQLGGHVE